MEYLVLCAESLPAQSGTAYEKRWLGAFGGASDGASGGEGKGGPEVKKIVNFLVRI